jgi:hypothetical protein
MGMKLGRSQWEKKRSLRVFENRLRGIFGPKRDNLIGEWRKLHNEKLSDLLLIKYYSGEQIEKKEMGGACSMCRGEKSY